ncbi:hypothetical protein B0H17DRAFT_407925 [Mycena rosella]|uniref:F-box domain-containing protein n=1 Tax=Mycena rosella TaxID=1033263 RepID=A0AAD7CLS7_MYCRO|nr:hypothetical protein B0H17DRAFT_407925 [Mycena rosella]
MLFHDLNEDVVAEILSSCDVHTVLCVSRVNKHFRAIALEKQLWMLLLRRLAFQGFIDLAPEETFVTQTTSDLIDEVKCLIFGPKTWSPTWSSPPIPKRQIILPFKHERPLESRTHSITLLPGGRHFVFHDQASLRFFDAATGRVVCSYQHPASIQFWSYAMSGGGDETFVAMAGALNQCV